MLFKVQFLSKRFVIRVDKLFYAAKYSRSRHAQPEDIWGRLQVPRNTPVAIAVDVWPRGHGLRKRPDSIPEDLRMISPVSVYRPINPHRLFWGRTSG